MVSSNVDGMGVPFKYQQGSPWIRLVLGVRELES